MSEGSDDFFLQELLPENYDYKVIAFNVKEQTEDNIKCDIETRVDIKTVEGCCIEVSGSAA